MNEGLLIGTYLIEVCVIFVLYCIVLNEDRDYEQMTDLGK